MDVCQARKDAGCADEEQREMGSGTRQDGTRRDETRQDGRLGGRE